MPTLPIVLAHGIARFDILTLILRQKLGITESVVEDRFQYFKGIKTFLSPTASSFSIEATFFGLSGIEG
jgi:hypothetical protein